MCVIDVREVRMHEGGARAYVWERVHYTKERCVRAREGCICMIECMYA